MGIGSGKVRGGQDTFEAIEPGISQSVAFSGVSSLASQLSGKTSIVRLFSTQDCFLAFGTAQATPTANSTTGYFLPAGIIDYVGVNAGPMIAVIQSTASGTLYITEGL